MSVEITQEAKQDLLNALEHVLQVMEDNDLDEVDTLYQAYDNLDMHLRAISVKRE